jgi:hypothetical protein
MSTLCKGCNAIVKRSGLYPHLQHSRNPKCELYHRELDEGALLPNNDSNTTASQAQAHVANTEETESEMAVIMECLSDFIS